MVACAVVGDVDAVAAQVGHAVEAPSGPADVDEHPSAARGRTRTETPVPQRSHDAHNADGDKRGEFVG
jgi:hypothetical protein